MTRAKDNMQYRVAKKRLRKPEGKILRDDEIVLKGKKSRGSYPTRFRRVKAAVMVDGKEKLMVFITNHTGWAAGSICDLYRCRWSIETFFKQLKQTLQLCDFVGHNERAVKWQVWIALLTYVLLKYLAYLSNWNHSMNRIWTMIRGVVWSHFELIILLRRYGTAGGCYRALGRPEQAYLPGFGVI